MEEKQKIFGYARTSTREQNEDRQIIALKEMGVPEKNIFEYSGQFSIASPAIGNHHSG